MGTIRVSPEILTAVAEGTARKGDVLGTARIAGIMAAKRTAELIPLCHVLPIHKCTVDFELCPEQSEIRARCTVKTEGKTGVEMEALTGVSVALLTVYDMCKAIDKRMVLSQIHLEEKSGGKSGDFRFASCFGENIRGGAFGQSEKDTRLTGRMYICEEAKQSTGEMHVCEEAKQSTGEMRVGEDERQSTGEMRGCGKRLRKAEEEE